MSPGMPMARSLLRKGAAAPRTPSRAGPPSRAPRPSRSRERSRAQALVEFAIITPVMLMLLVIATDFGRLFFSYIQISNASREAAAYGAVYPTDTATMTTYALRETNSQGQVGEHVPVVTAACADSAGATVACSTATGGSGSGNSLTVSVSEQFSFITPFISGFFGNGFHITASSSTAVLGFAPNGGASTPSSCSPPTLASFTVAITNLDVSLDASASTPDTGQCAIASYDWDMGDGTDPFPPVVGKTATYTYSWPQTVQITLTVSNPGGQLVTTQLVTVGAIPTATPTPTPTPSPTPTPTPTPTATPTCTLTPIITYHVDNPNAHKVTFTGGYTGSPVPVSWAWTFGDGGTSSVQNPPQHNYGAGTYTVRLTVTNGTCVHYVEASVNPS